MEPLAFIVRVPFEVAPEGEGKVEDEKLWVEVITWEDETLIGKLVDGGQTTTEWRKGAMSRSKSRNQRHWLVTRRTPFGPR